MRYIGLMIGLVFFFSNCNDSISPSSNKHAPSDWFYAQRAFPYGQIDHEAYVSALSDRKRSAITRSSQEGYNDPWIPVGPTNINGRITDIEMPPSDVNTIYVGSASGGIFKSTNQGDTWNPIFDDAMSLSIGDMAVAPSDEDIIYVGTGEANAGGGSLAYDGVGVYKSEDAGQSWTHLGLENVGSIGKVIVHPSDPNIVYVAAMGRLFGNNDERGVYATRDGGQSWEQVFFISEKTGAIDLAIHPTQPDTIFAAMWERERRPNNRIYGGATSGIYRSADGGENWEELDNGLPIEPEEKGRIGIAIAPTNPNVLYTMYAKQNGSLQGLYKTTDGGGNWSRIAQNSINDVPFMWWFGKVFTHPMDENIAYATSLDMHRTTNGGSSWIPIFEGVHVDHHALYVHPLNPDLVINGNDGGLYISQDGGRVWEHKNSLPNIQFYTCEIDPHNPERLFGGTQDNGTLALREDTEDWEFIMGGDGFKVLVDPNDPNIVFAESQNGNLRKSTNGGRLFSSANKGIGGIKNWNAPYVFDPNDSDVLYFGSDKVYQTIDQGSSWLAISPQIPLATTTGNINFGTITSLAVSTLDTKIIYAGTDDGQVSITKDGGVSWETISANLPERWITGIATDPIDTTSVYVTLSGYRYDEVGAHVYKSKDLGQTWSDISENLPDIPVNDIIIDEEESGYLYVATDIGVYYSTNDGREWTLLGTDFPLVPVVDIDMDTESRKLVAASYGRSMFSYFLPLPTSTTEVDDPTFKLYPNPTTGLVHLSSDQSAIDIQIYNQSGELILKTKGNSRQDLNLAHLESGIYFVKANNSTYKVIKI